MVVVHSLHVYPIKSCRGIDVTACEIMPSGPANDRRWMLVDEAGNFLTQRTLPRMTCIVPRFEADGLSVTAPGMRALHIRVDDGLRPRRTVRVWRFEGPAEDEGDDAALWFSEALGRPARLVRFSQDVVRRLDPAYAPHGQVAFADGYPLLVISNAALAQLNARLTAPVHLHRFRPNLVIEGCAPHAEDRWRTMRIGVVTLDIVKPCDRCSIPSVDPNTGERGVEPLRTLSTYRVRGGKVYFGQNAVPRTCGTIRAGDAVEVLA